MSDKTKKQFYFSDKPIDLQDIASNIEEPLEMPIDWEEATKPHTISFDCEVPKETADWFKKQMEELHEKENEILEKYSKIAKWNAEYYLHVINDTEKDEDRKQILESVIMHSLCKGWNDCFDTNVKREKH